MTFEVECIWKGKELRYGFSINTLGLQEEWFYQKKERWSEIFYRKKQVVRFFDHPVCWLLSSVLSSPERDSCHDVWSTLG